jgi:hypothetical protein
MQKVSLKKISILGIVLLAASAIAAAMSNKAEKKFSNNGVLLGSPETDDELSCVGFGSQCTHSIIATTTTHADGDSFQNAQQTIGNTSDGVNQSVF